MVHAVWAGGSASKRGDPIDYAIIDVSDPYTRDTDVAVLSRRPETSPPVRVAGILRPVDLISSLYVLSGEIYLANSNLYTLYKFMTHIVKEKIPAGELAEAVIRAVSEEAEAVEVGDDIIFVKEQEVEVSRFIKISILYAGGAREKSEVASLLFTLYKRAGGSSRKRAFYASPVVIEVTVGDARRWFVSTLTNMADVVLSMPENIVAAGIISPEMFRAPILVIRDVPAGDLPTLQRMYNALDKIENILLRGPTSLVTGRGTGAAGGEYYGL